MRLKKWKPGISLFCVRPGFGTWVLMLLACLIGPSTAAQGAADPRLTELAGQLARGGGSAAQVQAAWLEVRQRHSEVAQASAEARTAAWDAYVGALRSLIEEPASQGHPLRPVARVDLAETWLVDRLQRQERLADGFVEFGVPTAAQRAAFDAVVPEAVAQLAEAEGELRDLQAQVGRDAALRQALEVTGGEAVVFGIYRDQKLPWYAASAGYLSTWVTGAEGRAAEAEAVLRRLRPWLDDGQPGGGGGMAERAMSLAGRATLASGRAEEALRAYLRPAVSSAQASAGTTGGWSTEQLFAALAEARAVGRASGGEAERVKLEAMRERPAVRGRFDFRLLVCDALHLAWRAEAEGRQGAARSEALAEAYGVYDAIRAAPEYGAGAAAVERLVFERWAAELPTGAGFEEVVSDLPATVRAAVAQVSREQGQRLGVGDAGGVAQLERAVTAGRSLADRSTAGDEAWAWGTYEAGFARYLLEPGSAARVAEVMESLVEVAETTPQQPAAPRAIDLAMRLGEAWHRQLTGGGETPEQWREEGGAGRRIVSAYEAAGALLYGSDRYASTATADDRLLYFATAVVMGRGDYADAEALLGRQLKGHENFAEAQVQRLRAMTRQVRATPAGAVRDQRASDLLDLVRRVDGIEEGGEVGQRLAAQVRLSEAEVSVARGDMAGALEETEDWAEAFAGDASLVAEGLTRRVLWLVEAERWDQVRAEAEGLMRRFPDVAAGVIQGVLVELQPAGGLLATAAAEGSGAGEGRRGVDAREGGERLRAAAGLARQLADWAAGRGLSSAELVPYRLEVVRALRQAGDAGAALAYLRESGLERDGADQATVLYEAALALRASGSADDRREAAARLNRVIQGVEAQVGGAGGVGGVGGAGGRGIRRFTGRRGSRGWS